MAKLGRADRKAMVTEITTVYNHGEQKTISACTNHLTLRWMSYKSRRPHRVPLLLTWTWGYRGHRHFPNWLHELKSFRLQNGSQWTSVIQIWSCWDASLLTTVVKSAYSTCYRLPVSSDLSNPSPLISLINKDFFFSLYLFPSLTLYSSEIIEIDNQCWTQGYSVSRPFPYRLNSSPLQNHTTWWTPCVLCTSRCLYKCSWTQMNTVCSQWKLWSPIFQCGIGG